MNDDVHKATGRVSDTFLRTAQDCAREIDRYNNIRRIRRDEKCAGRFHFAAKTHSCKCLRVGKSEKMSSAKDRDEVAIYEHGPGVRDDPSVEEEEETEPR